MGKRINTDVKTPEHSFHYNKLHHNMKNKQRKSPESNITDRRFCFTDVGKYSMVMDMYMSNLMS